jgi:serine/threonine-protein kinase RIO1
MELQKRPGRVRRKDDVQHDMIKMGVKRWRTKAMDRGEWRNQDDMTKIGVKRWRTKAMDRREWRKYVRRPRYFKNCRATEKKMLFRANWIE